MLIDGKEMAFEIDGKSYHCALSVTMGYIGGKWKTVILWYLRKGAKRFSELKRHIPDITEKMLSLQLRELEADGLIERKIFAEVPPRVEYSFTDFGNSMIPMLESIAAWGRDLGQSRGTMVEVVRETK